MARTRYNTPKIKESKGIQLLTTVWLIPFIAMVIALWLAFQYYAKIGPLVIIEFQKNAGLVAKQSHVKMRNVIVGTVESVALSKEGEGVTVKIRMKKELSPYLNESARFWIVHPDVDSSGITGLDTILSGSYIEVRATKSVKSKTYFIGLEEAENEIAKGQTYLLSAPNTYHLKKGSNVYYRMMKIGKVQHVDIDENGKKINFILFVYDKFTKYITKESKFYTTSSLSVDVSQGKLDVNVASLSQLARGGISIYTPTQSLNQKREVTLPEGYYFPLYKSLNQMRAKHLQEEKGNEIYKFKFNEKITTLEIGSPIKFNDFKVGSVIDITSHFDHKAKTIQSEVYAVIHTKSFIDNQNPKGGKKSIETLVKEGLTAQLNLSVPLIGSQYIELVFNPHHRGKLLVEKGELRFPTMVKKTKSNLLNETELLVKKIRNLQLEKLVTSATDLLAHNEKPVTDLLTHLDASVATLDKTLEHFDMVAQNVEGLTQQDSLQNLPADLETTLYEVTQTLKELQTLSQDYNADSKFSVELSLTLQTLLSTAESMGKVSQTLERKSNALILGDE